MSFRTTNLIVGGLWILLMILIMIGAIFFAINESKNKSEDIEFCNRKGMQYIYFESSDHCVDIVDDNIVYKEFHQLNGERYFVQEERG